VTGTGSGGGLIGTGRGGGETKLAGAVTRAAETRAGGSVGALGVPSGAGRDAAGIDGSEGLTEIGVGGGFAGSGEVVT
jgi:hypothetical protein